MSEGKNRMDAPPGNLQCKRDFDSPNVLFTFNLILAYLGKFQLELKSFNSVGKMLRFSFSVDVLGLVKRKQCLMKYFRETIYCLGLFTPYELALCDIVGHSPCLGYMYWKPHWVAIKNGNIYRFSSSTSINLGFMSELSPPGIELLPEIF